MLVPDPSEITTEVKEGNVRRTEDFGIIAISAVVLLSSQCQ